MLARGKLLIGSRWANGKINLDDTVSHRLPLDEINKGFELATSGRAVRVVVVFN